MATLDELLERLNGLSPEDRKTVDAAVAQNIKEMPWAPNPGPQTDAYFCKADLLLYGGQGGGGKSDLLAGLAMTAHTNSLIMRRQYTDLGALTERLLTIHGSRDGFNGSPPPKLRAGSRLIEFGAAAKLGDEEHWQGQAHDLLGFDEAVQFLEAQIRFLMGWVRPRSEADIDIRCRTILASNPPLSAEGMWLIGMFRPWLDNTHKNPAKVGELRWYITDPDGKDLEVEGPDDCREWNGEIYRPQSRTFIPAALKDNPFLVQTNYQATLDSMPEPMRSAIRDGNFMAAREDDVWQVIPTSWVLAANERWYTGKPVNAPMTAIGLDVARGGRDETVLAKRYDQWIDELVSVPGKETPDGPSVVALVAKHLRDGACINVDAIGVGASVQDHLDGAGLDYVPIVGSQRSTRATRDGKFHFLTKRSEMWWLMREALDPDYGTNLALPPDPKLLADLTTPTYEVRTGEPPKIYVESKEAIIKRLGRSPDQGDAVAYALEESGPRLRAVSQKRLKRRSAQSQQPEMMNSPYNR